MFKSWLNELFEGGDGQDRSRCESAARINYDGFSAIYGQSLATTADAWIGGYEPGQRSIAVKYETIFDKEVFSAWLDKA